PPAGLAPTLILVPAAEQEAALLAAALVLLLEFAQVAVLRDVAVEQPLGHVPDDEKRAEIDRGGLSARMEADSTPICARLRLVTGEEHMRRLLAILAMAFALPAAAADYSAPKQGDWV